ncbi:MAG: polysaccharide biosynthesis tyrosine autokinase [Prevotella sp.]|jgi:capsular exopolysaccharide synthesis family protein|nr:polysaccharide biosynthesis tyrosine autokinase [Prevotella sp.]
MDINNNRRGADPDPYFEEVKSKTNISFDYVLWFYRILKYWYLFVISIALFVGYAYLENKKWIPYSSTEAKLLFESTGALSVVSGAVPTGSLLRSTETQQLILNSYELTERTVKKLPVKMHVEYFLQTRFKTISFYTDSPIEIIIDSLERDIKPEAYNYIYNITYVNDSVCEISYQKAPDQPVISLLASFDTPIPHELFRIRLKKSHPFLSAEKSFRKDIKSFSFRFLNDNQLIGIFSGRVSSRLLDPNALILAVNMSGPDPDRDKDYMDILLEAFQEYNLILKNKQADITINFLDEQLKLFNDSLDMSRIKLETLQKETGVYEVTSQGLRIEMDSAEREIDYLAIKDRSIRLLSEKVREAIVNDKAPEIIEPVALGIINPRLNQYILEYNTILRRYKNLGEKNPLYYKTVDLLDESRIRIIKEVQIMQVQLQDQKDALVRKYELIQKRTENLPSQERDLVKYQREYRNYEMYHQFLTQRKREAEIQRASNKPDIDIWGAPRVTSRGFNAGEKNKNYMFFIVLGFILPLGFVVLKEEVLNFTIMTKEECEKISGFPVIGTIENISKKNKTGAVLVKNYPKSSFAESFRNMRVRIEYMAQRENKITVLVTSTEPADGKTFIATNVASVYQLMGKKVVIIDLDLRRPSVAKTLQIEGQVGVSNYLIGQVSLEDIVVTHPDYGFDIIPAGALPPNPSELIKTAKTRQMLEYLKEIYDYVIIDCSPVGLVSDAYILSEVADTTLFVVRRAKTNKSFFKSVVGQLKYDGVENIALVFNDVKGREGYYGTSRYYGDRTYYLKKNSYYHDDYYEN